MRIHDLRYTTHTLHRPRIMHRLPDITLRTNNTLPIHPRPHRAHGVRQITLHPRAGRVPGQSTNQNDSWESGAASRHGGVPATPREIGLVPPPAANTNNSSCGPGFRLAPLQAREDHHGERAPEGRKELKDDQPGGMMNARRGMGVDAD